MLSLLFTKSSLSVCQAYGAAVVAIELAKAFGTDVNGLPLSFAVSWFEQKAVAILLTLLHLGVKDIRCVLGNQNLGVSDRKFFDGICKLFVCVKYLRPST